MSDDIEKKSSLIEFSQAIGAVLGAPIVLFTIINNIFQQPIISLVIAIITGIGLSIWLAYSRKMNFAYLAIAWLALFVIILLGFVIWPNTMTLEGFVNDSNGKPVVNETVKFFDYRGQIYETQTDQNGFYQFADVPTGKYRIRVRTTEIQGESKGLLVRVVSQSISVPFEVVDAPTPTATNTATPTPTPTNIATPTKTPNPTPTATKPKLPQSTIPIFDSFEGEFRETKWFIDVNNPAVVSYYKSQKDGQLCIDIQNDSGNDQDVFLRSKVSSDVKQIEADVTFVSGNGTFGLDAYGEQGWDNFLLDSNEFLRVRYGPRGRTEEDEILQSVECCPASHRLKMIFNDAQTRYFFDEIEVGSRTKEKNLPVGYGLVISPYARNNIEICVDEIRVEFD